MGILFNPSFCSSRKDDLMTTVERKSLHAGKKGERGEKGSKDSKSDPTYMIF